MTDTPIEDLAIALSAGSCSQLNGYDTKTRIQPRSVAKYRGYVQAVSINHGKIYGTRFLMYNHHVNLWEKILRRRPKIKAGYGTHERNVPHGYRD